jgi:hypothetical protein
VVGKRICPFTAFGHSFHTRATPLINNKHLPDSIQTIEEDEEDHVKASKVIE